MFFNKKRAQEPPSRRGVARPQLPTHHPLIVELGLPSGEIVPGSLLDLTIDGSGVLIPRVLVSNLAEGDCVQFSVQHLEHGWRV